MEDERQIEFVEFEFKCRRLMEWGIRDYEFCSHSTSEKDGQAPIYTITNNTTLQPVVVAMTDRIIRSFQEIFLSSFVIHKDWRVFLQSVIIEYAFVCNIGRWHQLTRLNGGLIATALFEQRIRGSDSNKYQCLEVEKGDSLLHGQMDNRTQLILHRHAEDSTDHGGYYGVVHLSALFLMPSFSWFAEVVLGGLKNKEGLSCRIQGRAASSVAMVSLRLHTSIFLRNLFVFRQPQSKTSFHLVSNERARVFFF